jgi:glucokinase
MENFLGIDVGGTNVKVGVVSKHGKIRDKIKYSTTETAGEQNLLNGFIDILKIEFEKHPKINKIGIGIPGTLSKDRSTIIETPNVPQLNGMELLSALQGNFPGKIFHLENDANAAALGEYYFSADPMPDNFIFITLGTGIGGAAIIDKQIFKGGDGNAMEVGHVLSRFGNTIEHKIGKKGLVNLAIVELGKYEGETLLTQSSGKLTAKLLEKAALKNDPLAIKVFQEMGTILGEAMVGLVRVLDIKTIVIGGGVADNFHHIADPMQDVLMKHLTPYYTGKIQVRKAALGNDAGIIGAASLCFMD